MSHIDAATGALLRRALVLLRAYALDAGAAGQVDRYITCTLVADEIEEALAPRSARLMPPLHENEAGNRAAP